MLFAHRSSLLIVKKRCPHLKTKSLTRLHRTSDENQCRICPVILTSPILDFDDIINKKNVKFFFPVWLVYFRQHTEKPKSGQKNWQHVLMPNFSTNISHNSNRFSAPESPSPQLSSPQKLSWELAPLFWVRAPTRQRGTWLRRAFQMPVLLIAGVFREYFYMRFIGGEECY